MAWGSVDTKRLPIGWGSKGPDDIKHKPDGSFDVIGGETPLPCKKVPADNGNEKGE